MKVVGCVLSIAATGLLAACSNSSEQPSDSILVDGVNFAVGEQILAGTHPASFNTTYVPISLGKCESVQVLNHYTRTLNGGETYHFYELKGKFPHDEQTFQIGCVKRGKRWFYRLGN